MITVPGNSLQKLPIFEVLNARLWADFEVCPFTAYRMTATNQICQNGDFQGCPCGTRCGNLISQPCDQYGCAGINNPDLGIGVCTAGTYLRRVCSPTCPSSGKVSCMTSTARAIMGYVLLGDTTGAMCRLYIVANVGNALSPGRIYCINS